MIDRSDLDMKRDIDDMTELELVNGEQSFELDFNL